MDDWIMKTFFIQGLNSDLEAYTTPKKQPIEENNKDLTLNEMKKTLIEYKPKMKDQKSKTKILEMAKNNKKINDKAKNSNNQKSKQNKKLCPICEISSNLEKDCHYTHSKKGRRTRKLVSMVKANQSVLNLG